MNWSYQRILVISESFSVLSRVNVLKLSLLSRITGSHKLMNGILANFHKTTREISFDVKKDSITIKNHIDNEDIDHESIRSNYTLRIDEFDTFSIKENCTIAFTLADFRAMIHFAEASEAFVRISFEAPGEPLCMSCRDQDAFVANLLVATMLHDMEDTGQDPIKSTSDKTTSQRSNIADEASSGSVAKPKASSVRRRRRVIDTQDDENPFNFMNDDPVPQPQAIRNGAPSKVSEVPSVPPSIVLETQSSNGPSPSHVSETDPYQLLVLNKPSSLISCPPLVDPNKQSEDIFFETEESESRDSAEVIIPESAEDSVPDTPPSSQFLRRRRFIFARCFEKTFDMRAVPGANEILAVNSDEEG